MAKDNLINLAKGVNKKQTPIPVATKKPVVKMVEKPKTPDEERNLKAKQKVEELLQSVELSPKKEVIPEVVLIPKEGTEWLEEQVALLSEQCEGLRAELIEAKDNYSKIYRELQNGRGNNSDNLTGETFKENILMMFNELQSNYLGQNTERQRWSVAKIEYLLNQMLQLFPFTQNYKKF